jgi:glycosyltransferase involved in cell wall biosynthesis
VIIGSYDWLPKRVNLIEFLRVADPLFAAAGVELLVVGGADPRFLESLSRTTRATRFTGPVADARAHLADARIGIAAERVGGGFKMKTLDYVFHRVPLAALAGTIPGLPVRDGKSALICPDASLLARRIIGVIDDFDTLNRMQRLAYKASAGVFAVANAARVLRRAAAGPDPADQEVPILAPAAAL